MHVDKGLHGVVSVEDHSHGGAYLTVKNAVVPPVGRPRLRNVIKTSAGRHRPLVSAEVEAACLLHVGILSRVGVLVLEPLEGGVHEEGQAGAHAGAQPVDPVVIDETSDDSRAERSGGVDGCASPVGRSDVRNED